MWVRTILLGQIVMVENLFSLLFLIFGRSLIWKVLSCHPVYSDIVFFKYDFNTTTVSWKKTNKSYPAKDCFLF